jgi:TatD DNase family protein
MFIDSHCHLNLLAQEEGGLDAVIAQARDAQIEHILCISIDKESCQQILDIADKYPNITASVGRQR